MTRQQIKIIVALILFVLCIVAPALIGVLLIGLVMYIFADIIVDRIMDEE